MFSQLCCTPFIATTVLNRPVAGAEHTRTYTQWQCFTPTSALPDQEDSCRKFPEVANYLLHLFFSSLLGTAQQTAGQ